ncbi:MAG: hypothetical protein R3E39_16720 [Anaerolineae bacterium]
MTRRQRIGGVKDTSWLHIMVLAAINGFLGVALGAFAAHSLDTYFSDKPRLEANFKTGVQ